MRSRENEPAMNLVERRIAPYGTARISPVLVIAADAGIQAAF
jgi:hypothetical protein